jgi:hypothetical protein
LRVATVSRRTAGGVRMALRSLISLTFRRKRLAATLLLFAETLNHTNHIRGADGQRGGAWVRPTTSATGRSAKHCCCPVMGFTCSFVCPHSSRRLHPRYACGRDEIYVAYVHIRKHSGAMSQISDEDYYTLDRFVIAVLTRVQAGECSVGEGRSDLMHPLAAWDSGNWHEFRPWMKDMLDRWKCPS